MGARSARACRACGSRPCEAGAQSDGRAPHGFLRARLGRACARRAAWARLARSHGLGSCLVAGSRLAAVARLGLVAAGAACRRGAARACASFDCFTSALVAHAWRRRRRLWRCRRFPPLASPLWAVVSPPFAYGPWSSCPPQRSQRSFGPPFSEGDHANALPLPNCLLPVEASPPSPPVASALPPVTELPPWSTLEVLLWPEDFSSLPLQRSQRPWSFELLLLRWSTTALLRTLASPPSALALPPLPPLASPLRAAVSPPRAFAPSPMAIALPLPNCLLPVEASPPSPPVAVAPPPVTELPPWSTSSCSTANRPGSRTRLPAVALRAALVALIDLGVVVDAGVSAVGVGVAAVAAGRIAAVGGRVATLRGRGAILVTAAAAAAILRRTAVVPRADRDRSSRSGSERFRWRRRRRHRRWPRRCRP